MAKQKTVVPFQGTPEQEQKLREVIASYRDTQGALMPVLQKAQDIYGYLPIEVQTIIAEELGLSTASLRSIRPANIASPFALAQPVTSRVLRTFLMNSRNSSASRPAAQPPTGFSPLKPRDVSDAAAWRLL